MVRLWTKVKPLFSLIISPELCYTRLPSMYSLKIKVSLTLYNTLKISVTYSWFLYQDTCSSKKSPESDLYGSSSGRY
jgi:hypothetical protein